MKYKYVIWDFNGTIVDDTLLSLNSINKVLKKRSLPRLKGKEDLQKIFCFPVKEYYRKLGMDFSVEPYEIPADEWVKEYTAGMFSCPLTDGIENILQKIDKSSTKQIILSASEKDMMMSQLKRLGIADLFDEILGCDNVYAGGKAHIAAEWIEHMGREKVFPAVMIGDTDHDFDVAKTLGCDCVLYSGGFMSEERLRKFSVPVFGKFSEIEEYIFRQ